MAGKKEVFIDIPKPLLHQQGPLDSTKRFKAWRWGRRGGKTRAAFQAATAGHGAGRGMLDGGEVLWVARDYSNSDVIWRKEILKRFANKPGFEVNKQDRRVTCLANGGTLTISSAENIDSVRGGDWDGIILDEAGHYDLHYVWLDVVRPGLSDRLGWAILMSTTKTGSYFNSLCETVMEKTRGDSWGHWYLTALDNPKIDNDEFQALVDEYDDEVKLKQEVYAELVVPGGFAFPEWNTAVHVAKIEAPAYWTWVGCMDWGYMNPGWFGLCAVGPDGERFFRWEFKFQQMEPYDVGFQVGLTLASKFPRPIFISGDSAMFSRTQGELTIADEIQRGLNTACKEQAPALIAAPKGPGSRLNGKILMHQAMKWTPHPDKPNEPKGHWAAPRLRFHPDCAYAISTIPKLTRDERNQEDVDTTGADHAYDAIRYLLLTHAPKPQSQVQKQPDMHPGISKEGRRKTKSWERQFEVDPEITTRYWRGNKEIEA